MDILRGERQEAERGKGSQEKAANSEEAELERVGALEGGVERVGERAVFFFLFYFLLCACSIFQRRVTQQLPSWY